MGHQTAAERRAAPRVRPPLWQAATTLRSLADQRDRSHRQRRKAPSAQKTVRHIPGPRARAGHASSGLPDRNFRRRRRLPAVRSDSRMAHLPDGVGSVQRAEIESVAVEAHDAASLSNVAELVGELQQRELAFDTLTQNSHSGFSSGKLNGSHPQSTQKTRVAARPSARVGEQPKLSENY